MDERSRLLTTFNTPWGRFCFVKMPFGLNQAQYFFQYYMDYHFKGINSTTNITVDEVMIHRETDLQHDRHLIQVLNKCREIGLKLNPEECTFGATEVPFFSHTVSSSGLHAYPKKIQSIVIMPLPSDKTQLNSFIGMCNYLMNYLPHLIDIILPLRGLAKKITEFTWNRTYDNAFNSAKEHIKNA